MYCTYVTAFIVLLPPSNLELYWDRVFLAHGWLETELLIQEEKIENFFAEMQMFLEALAIWA
jgi:hypothetical protein